MREYTDYFNRPFNSEAVRYAMSGSLILCATAGEPNCATCQVLDAESFLERPGILCKVALGQRNGPIGYLVGLTPGQFLVHQHKLHDGDISLTVQEQIQAIEPIADFDEYRGKILSLAGVTL